MLINITLPQYIEYGGEKAKRIDEFYGYYVTNYGLVVSVKVPGGRGKIDINNPHVVTLKTDKDGYYEAQFSMVEDGKHKRVFRRVHRITYETWVEKIPDDLTIDHIDCNRQNNHIDNLRVMTRESNSRRAKVGKKSPKRNLYEVYQYGVFIGIKDEQELHEEFGLNHSDCLRSLNKPTKRVKSLGLVLALSVEDNERVDND